MTYTRKWVRLDEQEPTAANADWRGDVLYFYADGQEKTGKVTSIPGNASHWAETGVPKGKPISEIKWGRCSKPSLKAKVDKSKMFTIGHRVDIQGGRQVTAFMLYSNVCNDEFLAAVEVRHYWDDEKWYHFRPLMLVCGEEHELFTQEKAQSHYDYLKQTAGEGEADAWLDTAHVIHKSELGTDQPAYLAWAACQEMQKRFEALLALEIFDLSVTF